jgi:cytochrome c oxidase subunit 2
MALTVIVEPEPQFEAWLVKERRAAEAPQTPEQQRGRDLVAHGSCALCHSVQGDGPSAHLGPDLTHFASRPTIAAGELENTPENLAAWLADPQRIKVGSRMPATGLRGDDLQAVVAYLEQLK